MTAKDEFSPDDWTVIRDAPWVVAIAVVAADPSGAVATSREFHTLRHLVAAMDDHGSPNEVIRAVADELTAVRVDGEPDPTGTLSGYDSIHEGAIEHCTSVVRILDDVAEPDESAEFRAWLLDLARAVAEAAKEGGFMGIGGTSVSEREATALNELAVVLRVGT